MDRIYHENLKQQNEAKQSKARYHINRKQKQNKAQNRGHPHPRPSHLQSSPWNSGYGSATRKLLGRLFQIRGASDLNVLRPYLVVFTLGMSAFLSPLKLYVEVIILIMSWIYSGESLFTIFEHLTCHQLKPFDVEGLSVSLTE